MLLQPAARSQTLQPQRAAWEGIGTYEHYITSNYITADIHRCEAGRKVARLLALFLGNSLSLASQTCVGPK